MLWQHWRISWHFQITTGIKSAIHGASTSGFIKFRNTLMYNTKQDLLGVHCIALSSFCWLAIRCSNVFLWAMQQLAAAGRWTSKVATNVGYLASIRSRHNKVLPCIATSCLHLSKHGGDSGGRPNLTQKYFISEVTWWKISGRTLGGKFLKWYWQRLLSSGSSSPECEKLVKAGEISNWRSLFFFKSNFYDVTRKTEMKFAIYGHWTNWALLDWKVKVLGSHHLRGASD